MKTLDVELVCGKGKGLETKLCLPKSITWMSPNLVCFLVINIAITISDKLPINKKIVSWDFFYLLNSIN